MSRRLFAAALAFTVLAGVPAAAQDAACAKTTRFPDRLICADPALREADRAMAAAYNAQRDRADAAGRRDLLAAQRAWLRERDQTCRGEAGDAAQVACLIRVTEARRTALNAGAGVAQGGKPGAAPSDPAAPQGTPTTPPSPQPPAADAPGTGPRLTTVTYERRNARTNCTISVRYPRLAAGGPQAAAFEETMRRAAIADDARECPAKPGEGEVLTYEARYRVTLSTPRLVSVAFAVSTFTGGVHPNSFTNTVMFDLQRGRPLALTEILDVERAAGAIETTCRAQFDRELQSRGADARIEADRDAFLSVIRDPAKWTLEPAGARLYFDPYAVAPYALGGFECALPSAMLRSFLTPDSVLR